MAVIELLPLAYVVLFVIGVLTFAYATDLVLRYKVPVGNRTEGADGIEEEEEAVVFVPLPHNPTIVEKYLEEELHPVCLSPDFFKRQDERHEDFLRWLESGLEKIESEKPVVDRDAAEDMPAKTQRAVQEEEKAVVVVESRPEGAIVIEETVAEAPVRPEPPVVLPLPPLSPRPSLPLAPSPPLQLPPLPSPQIPGLFGGWVPKWGLSLNSPRKHKAFGRLDRGRGHKAPRLMPTPVGPTTTTNTTFVPTVLPLGKDHPRRRRLPPPKFASILEATLRPLIQYERRPEYISGLKRVDHPLVHPEIAPASESIQGFLGVLRGEIHGGLARVEELERLLAMNRARVAEIDSREWNWEDTSSGINSEDEATLPVVLADDIKVVRVALKSSLKAPGTTATATRTPKRVRFQGLPDSDTESSPH